jgi:hypothetical protein
MPAGHRLGALTAEQNKALATTPADQLLSVSFLQPEQVQDSLHAYQLAKRGNSVRVMAKAVRWSKRGVRVNTISPGIIITPLAHDELMGPRGEGYRRMIELSPVRRAGTPDEVGNVAALLMGIDGAFITGSDFLDSTRTCSHRSSPAFAPRSLALHSRSKRAPTTAANPRTESSPSIRAIAPTRASASSSRSPIWSSSASRSAVAPKTLRSVRTPTSGARATAIAARPRIGSRRTCVSPAFVRSSRYPPDKLLER